MRFDSVINKFMFDSHFKGRISINGTGQQHRAFIHIDKTVNILSNLIFSDLQKGKYDLVEDNLTIGHIADTLKNIDPNLEMIFINQQLKMRELMVKPNEKLNSLTDIPVRSLFQVLSDFKESFTF